MPTTLPIVIPAVAPTNIPFFQPIINTIKMHKIFLIEYPNTLISPIAHTLIATNKLAPIISSIEYALFSPRFVNTGILFTNIL